MVMNRKQKIKRSNNDKRMVINFLWRAAVIRKQSCLIEFYTRHNRCNVSMEIKQAAETSCWDNKSWASTTRMMLIMVEAGSWQWWWLKNIVHCSKGFNRKQAAQGKVVNIHTNKTFNICLSFVVKRDNCAFHSHSIKFYPHLVYERYEVNSWKGAQRLLTFSKRKTKHNFVKNIILY